MKKLRSTTAACLLASLIGAAVGGAMLVILSHLGG